MDIPSQPVTYEANRRSITVTNIYGYGLLLGPSERTDAIVDFSAYPGQTLILYNDAPAPTPFNDQRDDYYTGDPDQTGTGGTYTTKPGYGPNTRTMMQIKVNAAPAGTTPAAFNANALLTALPAAYKASQAAPIVPESTYNAAFGTSDADNYAHVATGSVAQPNLDFTPTPAAGTVDITGVNLISSGGQLVVGTTNIVGNAIPGSGTGYLPAPVVNFNFPIGTTCTIYPVATAIADTDAVAAAAVPPHQPSYQVTSVTMTANGSACTAVPLITFTSTNGGVGAQGTVVASQAGAPLSQSILVQTKTEQELFDAAGRYNSTGGVELPLTSGTTQTTIPLNYTDSPTEMIADGEVQIWKLVDNGFWSNSMHFDFVDVQLINRVGWDGTVKAPASNEVGWKDTLRLNPLEDVVVAMRAKRPSVPFGQPASKRYQDPSLPAGAANRVTQLPFLADPGVTSPAGVALLTTTTNVTAQYDNEYVWNSAILGHSEDDFMRPIVFHPTVNVPAAPSILGGTGGALSWTDATPPGSAATLGNPANEIGFKVLRAAYSAQGKLGAYTQLVPGATPANVTSYTDTTQVAGTDYSYEVVAWNNAGSATSPAYTEITATAAPTWAATNPVVINASGTVTLAWNKVTGATGYIVTANGVALPVIAAAGGNGTQSATVTLPLGNINYTSITVTAQKVKYGLTANSVPSAALTADLTPPVAPTVTNVAATGLTLSWTAVTGATGYTLQYSTNGGTTWANVGTGTGGVRTTTASLGATSTSAAILGLTAGTSYSFQLRANNSTWSNPANVATTPGVPTVTSTGVSASGFTLNFAVAGATSYNVTDATGGTAVTTNQTTSTLTVNATPGTSYGPYTVQACDNNATTCSASSTAVTVITPPVAPAAPTAASVAATTLTLNWSAAAGATSYNVQRATNAGFTTGVTNIALGVTGTSQAVTGLTGNTSYYFRVQAVNGANTVSGTASAVVLTTPSTPTGVTAVNGTTGAPITGGLRWTAPAGGAASYLVSWSGPVSGSATTTSNTQLTFTTAGTYSMTVTAVNATGNSAPSTAVSVTVR